MNDNYDNFSKTFSKSRKNMKWGEIDYLLAHMMEHSQFPTILDVGCGSGRLLKEIVSLEPQNWSYNGVDNSEGMIQCAREENPSYSNSFMVCDMKNLGSLPLKTFNSIFFIASFHHLDNASDRQKVLEIVYGLLKPGGYLYLTNWHLTSDQNIKRYTPEKKYPDGSADFQIKIGDFVRYYHGFQRDTLESLYTQSGLSIIEHRLFDTGRNFISILQK